MAIEYKYLDRDDDALIATSELPVEEGIAVAVRTTGYELGTDEVVQLSIVDFQGNELLAQTVKPQNIEDWANPEASGGITPADVAEAPELFQFEDEITELFEKASIVVGLHVGFIHEIIESSWVSLPDSVEFDLAQEFCASHCTADFPGTPAAVAALSGIASYYGVECDEVTTTGTARAVAASYVALVKEHAAERLAKGADHWEAYERRKEEARKDDRQAMEDERRQQVKTLQINAILWLGAAAIFGNLAVQLGTRGVNFGIVVVVIAAAVYFAARWIASLYGLYKLRK